VALVQLASDTEAPEARERVLRVLRKMAIADYNKIGDGYCGIQMSQVPMMLDVPGLGKLASISLTFIVDDGPATKAGLKVNDAIVSVDDKVWKSPENQMEELREIIRKKGAGKMIKLGIMREGHYKEAIVQLHRRPPKIDTMNHIQANLLLRGGFQQIPKFDQQYFEQLEKEDRVSEEFFSEWLRNEKELRKNK
jgi:C-terminal processing protease CtpA/Prc